MLKKNLSVILVILLTLLLVALVIRVFDKRINAIEKRTESTTGFLNTKNP
jgi:hypothetical protein